MKNVKRIARGMAGYGRREKKSKDSSVWHVLQFTIMEKKLIFVPGLSGVDFIGIKGPSSQCSLQKYQENDQILILES